MSGKRARLAAELQPYLIAGQTIPCCIANFSGGGEYDTGVNIYIGAWVSPEQKSAAGTPYTFIKLKLNPLGPCCFCSSPS